MSGQLSFWKSPGLVSVMNQMTLGMVKARVASPSAHKPRKVAVQRPRFYRFYFLDKNGHIIGGEDIECESNEKAIDCGWDMFAFGDYPKIEVWVRDVRIGLMQAFLGPISQSA
jgi:hypothetical protein